jgi:hypothetical protein
MWVLTRSDITKIIPTSFLVSTIIHHLLCYYIITEYFFLSKKVKQLNSDPLALMLQK